MIIKYVSILLLITSFSSSGFAQETSDLYQTFQKVCTAYQYLPLQLEMSLSNSTNLPMTPMDTLHLKGEFDIQQNGSYLRFNNQEEVVNDSTLVVADLDLKRIVLSFQKSVPAKDRLQGFQKSFLQDSSWQNLSFKYRIESKKEGEIRLINRELVDSTSFPVQEIIAHFNSKSGEPYEVAFISRSVVVVSRTFLEQIRQQNPSRHYDIRNEVEGDIYVIKENRSVTHFENISHKERLPEKTINSYLAWTNGSYQLQGAYKNCSFTVFH